MAIKATGAEFSPDAISPQAELARHNDALRDNLAAVLEIKEALANDDFAECAMLWSETSEAVRDALWVAPSKGGIFTTEERKMLQSDELGAAMREYMQSKRAEQ